MSVVVMGMEMPENCHVCVLCFGGLCFAIPPEVDVMCPDEGRPVWCPLRPLPEKYGDLIDRNALLRKNRAYPCSGMEAWEIVAPLLVEYLPSPETNAFNLMHDAYITVYLALKAYEEDKK